MKVNSTDKFNRNVKERHLTYGSCLSDVYLCEADEIIIRVFCMTSLGLILKKVMNKGAKS